MRFSTLAEFIAMDGHGPYVWSAYAIAVVVIAFNLIWPLLQQRRNLSRLRREARAANQEEHKV